MMSVNFKDKYLKYKKKYLELCNNMIGGAAAGKGQQNYNSKVPVFEQNGINNTASIYIAVAIDVKSNIGKAIKERTMATVKQMPNYTCTPAFSHIPPHNVLLEPHVTLFEFTFDASTHYGQIITKDFTSGTNKIAQIIKDCFDNTLKNSLLVSNPSEYNILGSYFVRIYDFDANEYKKFKECVRENIFKSFGGDIKYAQNVGPKIKNHYIPIKVPSKLPGFKPKEYYYFKYTDKKGIYKLNYAIDAYFFGDGWKPHISLIRFAQPQPLLQDVEKIFKTVQQPQKNLSLTYITMCGIKDSVKGLKGQYFNGSLSNLTVTLNHPAYPMNHYKVSIKL